MNEEISYLFVPANKKSYDFQSVNLWCKCDHSDLEDAVHPDETART